MTNARFMFLRNAQGRPVGCLAITLDRKNHRVKYQMSVLNPTDQFDRKMARHIALGRLMEKPTLVPVPRDHAVTLHEVSTLVMSHVAESAAPSRAVRAAKQWLSTNKTTN